MPIQLLADTYPPNVEQQLAVEDVPMIKNFNITRNYIGDSL